MMARPEPQDEIITSEIPTGTPPNQQYPYFDQIKAQGTYVHPALIPKQPLQRRATAPTSRPNNNPQLQKHQNPPQPSQLPINNQQNGKPKLERPATIHHRYKRKIGPYTLTKTLGAGSMGKVKLGIHDVTGHKVAVKIITRKVKKSNASSDKDEDAALTDMAHEDKRVMREVSILFLLHHPFIVKMVDFMVTPHHYYLMFEYVEGGQLLDYIISHGKLNERTARKFARQIISSLDYCHRNSVVHRDLKIENILISNSGSIKIIDFGLSNLYSSKSQLSTFCGSLYFAAPELLSAKPYTGPEVDIWSFGIVLYVLMCGEVPFDDKSMTMIHHKIKRGVVKYPAWLSPDCRHLLSRILVTNPSERATMVEIMQHPWINKGFHGPPDSYFPNRSAPELPVDLEVIKQMTGFQFGSPEQIQKQVDKSIKEYLKEATSPTFSPRLTPCNKSVKAPISYPYLSIYSLAKEKLEREKNNDQSIVVKEEDRIDEDSEKSNSHIVLTADSGLSRSKSCKPTMNGVSGRYNAIPSRPSQLKESNMNQTNLRSNETNNDIVNNNNNSTTISRNNSDRRPSNGTLLPPNSVEMTKDNPTPRRTSIRFSDKSQIQKVPSTRVNKEKRLSEPLEKVESTATTATTTPTIPVLSVPNEPIKTPQRKPSRLEKISHFLNRGSSLREVKTPQPATEEIHSPSIKSPPTNNENPKLDTNIQPVFLKGLFSVATTSTKKPKIIRDEILRVLKSMNMVWHEGDGYISVAKNPSSLNATLSPILRKVSYTSNSELSSNENSDNTREEFSLPPSIHEVIEEEGEDNGGSKENQIGKRKMRVNKKSLMKEGTKLEVRFEIQIVKLSLIRLYGIKFRRLVGHSWEYKEICSEILSKLRI
ncbi:Pkinase-domain-containing protein [Neoconidiobolus thromboides FSU 785]|nr:Pkinase-domain-containing protein [Neoconidiobolus thromboides FSU 785]